MKRLLIKSMMLLGLSLTLFTHSSFAQEFAEPNATFSYKKTVYVYLESGDSVLGTLRKVGYKKSLIDELSLNIEGEKKPRKIDVNTVKMVYFPVANLALFAKKLDVATDLRKMERTGVNEQLIKEGYVLFEKTNTELKGKTEILLLELLNPAFCNKIKVFNDPTAGETQSIGFKGITVAGGDARSYYIKVGDQSAFKMKKGDFKESIAMMFGDCPDLEARLKDKYTWSDLAKYIYEHANCE